LGWRHLNRWLLSHGIDCWLLLLLLLRRQLLLRLLRLLLRRRLLLLLLLDGGCWGVSGVPSSGPSRSWGTTLLSAATRGRNRTRAIALPAFFPFDLFIGVRVNDLESLAARCRRPTGAHGGLGRLLMPTLLRRQAGRSPAVPLLACVLVADSLLRRLPLHPRGHLGQHRHPHDDTTVPSGSHHGRRHVAHGSDVDATHVGVLFGAVPCWVACILIHKRCGPHLL
jgi:hypothetical protein